ncbi:type II toxin-antitoxin system RelE/ParE family toxin [Desulfobacula sp.]|uniref:type II toxin-antitoxin system RelE/ParE family toxin n=1 Tax=Desulfobacula sp. TaxID=2593537 RepID=UPI00261B0627|nr:type II toxin-antitoxin system RelE/ParE family toxin [Desulfobacula sp.]
MQKKWHILFCDEIEQACPVTEFINQCPPRHQVKVLRLLSLLEEQGPVLPRPYADVLYDGIHELRFTLSRTKVRVLYFFCYQKFIVLYYVFFKATQKVPEKFIKKVIDYRTDFLERASRKKLEESWHAVF